MLAVGFKGTLNDNNDIHKATSLWHIAALALHILAIYVPHGKTRIMQHNIIKKISAP